MGEDHHFKAEAGRLTRRGLAVGFAAAGLSLGPSAAWAQRSSRLERRESQYNTIYIDREGEYVTMRFGVNQLLFTESKYNPNDPKLLPVEYTRFMTTALAYTPAASSLLEIGLGGGSTVQYLNLHMPEMQIMAVEIDPEVIALAKKYFGLRPGRRLGVTAMDGRLYLSRNRTLYDIIMVDAYRGTWVPEHLLSQEFFRLAKSRLKPGGVMAQNVEPTTMLFDAAIGTIKSVFDHADIFNAEGNVVVVAYDGPMKTQEALMASAEAVQARYQFRHPLPPMIAQRQLVTRATGRILTDDFNPAETLRAVARGNDRSGR